MAIQAQEMALTAGWLPKTVTAMAAAIPTGMEKTPAPPGIRGPALGEGVDLGDFQDQEENPEQQEGGQKEVGGVF